MRGVVEGTLLDKGDSGELGMAVTSDPADRE
jgi:hypothetical protein